MLNMSKGVFAGGLVPGIIVVIVSLFDANFPNKLATVPLAAASIRRWVHRFEESAWLVQSVLHLLRKHSLVDCSGHFRAREAAWRLG